MSQKEMSGGGIVSGGGVLFCIASVVGGPDLMLGVGVLTALLGVVIESASQKLNLRGD